MPTIWLFRGGLGVFSGFVLLAVGFTVTGIINSEMDSLWEGATPSQEAASVDLIVQTQGIEATLSAIAKEVPPQRVDEVTLLLRVEAQEATLRYVYEVSAEVTTLADTVRSGLIEQNCNYEGLRNLIVEGATIEHLYNRPDGTPLSLVTVDRPTCGM
jgi:hypothetical protein